MLSVVGLEAGKGDALLFFRMWTHCKPYASSVLIDAGEMQALLRSSIWSLMPAEGRFCRLMCFLGRLLAQLHTHCQKSSFLFPHSMVDCAIGHPYWQCSWLSPGSCMGAWLPAALSLTTFCLALRAASPYIPFPPVIQSFSSCSTHSLTQNH